MEKRVISFLSSQGRGFSVDLALTKNYLQSFFSQDEVFYRYYVNNEKSKNPLANEGFIRARKEFCRDMTDVFCVDPSLGRRSGRRWPPYFAGGSISLPDRSNERAEKRKS